MFSAVQRTFKSCNIYYAPDRREGAISVAFVRPSVCLSVRASVRRVANNSRTQRPIVPKFGMKVPHHRCDSHTSFKVKWSKVRVIDGWGHTASAEPGGHAHCLFISLRRTAHYMTYTELQKHGHIKKIQNSKIRKKS